MNVRWIMPILVITTYKSRAQIFPISSLLPFFDKSNSYDTDKTRPSNDIVDSITALPYPTDSYDARLSSPNSTITLQTTKTTIISQRSNHPMNITSEAFVTSWNDSSNFKTEENVLITSSSNDQPVSIAEPWTRSYKEVFNYGLKTILPAKKSYQKAKNIHSKYDQLAFVYPPFSSHHHPPHLPPPPLPHPQSSHTPQPSHYVFMKPYESSAESHKLDLNPLVPPSSEVTIDYYVTSSSPTYYEQPELNYYPPGVKHINSIDPEVLHTKKHYSKNPHRLTRPPMPPVSSQISHVHHPYPFYNNQVYLKPTPSYPPVKKFIATVRPIYATPSPAAHTHTTHIVKYTTPANTRFRVLPTLIDPIVDIGQSLGDNSLTIVGSTKSTPSAHDLLVPPRVPPMYYHEYHNPYSTLPPLTLADLKNNKNLLKQFNKLVSKNKEKRKKKKKKKKNESEDEDDAEKDTKEDDDVYEYEETDKEDDDLEDLDDEELPRKRKLKKVNKIKNNKKEESRLESYRTRPLSKVKKNVKEPYRYSGESYDKFLRDNSYPSIPKNHKLEQMDYGSWEKRGVSGESLSKEKTLDHYKSQGSNRVDVKHELQASPQEQTELMVQNNDGQRVEFQMHGQGGPESYKFGYDTGAGYNRQFRYEERDGEGHVKGHYGYYDNNGKLQVFNYAAHPEHGFQAEQTNANYEENADE